MKTLSLSLRMEDGLKDIKGNVFYSPVECKEIGVSSDLRNLSLILRPYNRLIRC